MPHRAGWHRCTLRRGRSSFANLGAQTELSLAFSPVQHVEIAADPPALYTHPGDHKKHINIQSLCSNDDLDGAVSALFCMGSPASTDTYLALLKACNRCKALEHLTSVRAHIFDHGIELRGLLGDYLVLSLAKCGAVSDAYSVCRTLQCRTVFSWTAIISAYAECCCGNEALEIFQHMQQDAVTPNNYTFVGLFKACGSIQDLNNGKKLHALARSEGLTSRLFVGNTLVSMYGKCGACDQAERVFDAMSEQDVVSWNAMLSAYIDQDEGKKALLLYRQMQKELQDSNLGTLVLALQACGAFVEESGPSGRLVALEIGRALHALVNSKGYTYDAVVGTALLHMYGNCGAVLEAEDIFASLSQHDIVSWTALLSAYLDEGQGNKVLGAYRQMHVQGISPNDITFGIVLQALQHLKVEFASFDSDSTDWPLEVGRALYVDIHKSGLSSNHTLGNPLISMFGRFRAGVPDAEGVFEALLERNTVSWNAILSAYVDHGELDKVLYLFIRMNNDDIPFSQLTFIALLQSCSELGSLDLGRRLHFDSCLCGYEQHHSVAATLIHAYGSCGSTTDAQAVLDGLWEPHIVSWNACIAGYAQDGNHESSMHATSKLMLAGNVPDDATLTSILTACSRYGLVSRGFDYLHSICAHCEVTPDVKHYGIMVDLLGRAGNFNHVQRLLEMMPMPPDLMLWLCLLSACRFHGNFVLANQAFDFLLHLAPKQGAAYVLFSNIRADIALEDFLNEAD
ncbi:hypothetical protein GOP47_0028740 [Adiantum capillus-veneris]|nr:hypothetical protein GOP47_0028740 [Adiantum capillus-veneris]